MKRIGRTRKFKGGIALEKHLPGGKSERQRDVSAERLHNSANETAMNSVPVVIITLAVKTQSEAAGFISSVETHTVIPLRLPSRGTDEKHTRKYPNLTFRWYGDDDIPALRTSEEQEKIAGRDKERMEKIRKITLSKRTHMQERGDGERGELWEKEKALADNSSADSAWLLKFTTRSESASEIDSAPR